MKKIILALSLVLFSLFLYGQTTSPINVIELQKTVDFYEAPYVVTLDQSKTTIIFTLKPGADLSSYNIQTAYKALNFYLTSNKIKADAFLMTIYTLGTAKVLDLDTYSLEKNLKTLPPMKTLFKK